MNESIKEILFDEISFPQIFVETPSCKQNLGLYIRKMLVKNYSYIDEGDELFEYETNYSNTKYIFISQHSGIFVLSPFPFSYFKGKSVFKIYPNELSLKTRFKYKITATVDEFTKHNIITCSFENNGYSNEFGFPMSLINISSIIYSPLQMNFEYADGKYFLLLNYRKQYVKIEKSYILHLLLDNNDVISLAQIAKPVKDICRFQLSVADMDKLETAKFTKWRITNREGLVIKSGDNACFFDFYDETGLTLGLSLDVFQNYIKDFCKTVKENIPQNEIEIVVTENTKVSNSCYVYLMIDTTNNFHKIGISNHPKYREHTLQSDKPTIELVCAKEYPSRAIAEAIEASLHRVFASKRIRGEWFNLDASDIEEVKQTLK